MTIPTTLYYTKREHYGRVDYYPACPFTRAITKISGRKVLSKHDRTLLEGLGFKFEEAKDDQRPL